MLRSYPSLYCQDYTTTVGVHRGALRLSIHVANGLYSFLAYFIFAFDAYLLFQEKGFLERFCFHAQRSTIITGDSRSVVVVPGIMVCGEAMKGDAMVEPARAEPSFLRT